MLIFEEEEDEDEAMAEARSDCRNEGAGIRCGCETSAVSPAIATVCQPVARGGHADSVRPALQSWMDESLDS
jgi:hypothetical protein